MYTTSETWLRRRTCYAYRSTFHARSVVNAIMLSLKSKRTQQERLPVAAAGLLLRAMAILMARIELLPVLTVLVALTMAGQSELLAGQSEPRAKVPKKLMTRIQMRKEERRLVHRCAYREVSYMVFYIFRSRYI
mmetsp:Transcript_11868/g.21681  ORF Transcript_11868/g.21681 Transcript_11868/m.21681 type:complete len:134 (+) Transcript_11868:520-921(+)